MSAPPRPTDATWEPQALELPLEPPCRQGIPRLPYWQTVVPDGHPDAVDDEEDQRSGPAREGEPGSHVIVIDIA